MKGTSSFQCLLCEYLGLLSQRYKKPYDSFIESPYNYFNKQRRYALMHVSLVTVRFDSKIFANREINSQQVYSESVFPTFPNHFISRCIDKRQNSSLNILN